MEKNVGKNKVSHNELGRELELFDTFSLCGGGHIFWKERGYKIFSNLSKWIELEHKKRGYRCVKTPIIYKSDIWEISGHKEMFSKFMYLFEIKKEDMHEEWGIKPMNCPAHILLFKSKRRFKEDLPFKIFELGTVHRHELSGVLNGLLRVRSFTQDDAHIFLTKDQLKDVIIEIIEFIAYTFDKFDLKDRKFFLSTMPEEHLGDEKIWKEAEKIMESALQELNVEYEINEGEGAFYGPKIDVEVKDSLGRLWQLSTVQLDFNLPNRFDVKYYDHTGKKESTFIIHRAVLGSLERFIGVLLEHFQGRLPLPFAPYQIALIPVKNTDNEIALSKEIKEEIEKTTQYIIEVDILSQEKTVSKRILEAQKRRYIHIVVIGEKEVKEKSVSLRVQGEKKTINISAKDYIKMIIDDYKKWF